MTYSTIANNCKFNFRHDFVAVQFVSCYYKEPQMEHQHIYDENGKQLCCTQEEKIYTEAGAEELLHSHSHSDQHSHSQTYLPALISAALLAAGIIFDRYATPTRFSEYFSMAIYIAAYLPVGFPVMKAAWLSLQKGEFFTEFTLMCVATIGAFVLQEYPEGVAVMLFYSVGELFQEAAVNRAKNSIKALLDLRPSNATVLRNGNFQTVRPEEVTIGETIQVKAGEKIPLDGVLLSGKGRFNTAALTGESKPSTVYKGENLLAGTINLEQVIELKVTHLFQDSAVSRILAMVQEATSRKAPTELMIRKLARIYTPVVFTLAVALVVVPALFVSDYSFETWLYRALIFLVISCPCALVISIPLGYFGGLGAASRHGILFKGSNYLDALTKVNTLVVDKTGTITKGVFTVQKVVAVGIPEQLLQLVATLEKASNHPVAKAITEYVGETPHTAYNIEEISGHGLKGTINGSDILAGNTRLLQKYGIAYDPKVDKLVETAIVVAIDGRYAGYILIADELKKDAVKAVKEWKRSGLEVIMLSGDKQRITEKVAKKAGIKTAFGDLLPEQKMEKVAALQEDRARVIAFVGDGINDAPVLALSQVGIAMGAMGSDAAIETADVVIQNDQLSRIGTAIRIGKATRRIVLQNIVFAFAVKGIVLVLGAGGLATMWEAVFADVGVALLAILNAIRIQWMSF